jgi:hypothetical protein
MCPVQNQQGLRVWFFGIIHPLFPQNNLSPCKSVQLRKQTNFTLVCSERHYTQLQEEMISQHLSKYRKTQYRKLGWSKTISIGTIEIN